MSDHEEKELITLALERFKRASEAESQTRKESLDDFRFSTGDQWPNDVKSDRLKDGRPCLTMDRLSPMIRHVVNEFRQQRPAPHINPVGDGADKQTADIMQGIIRHIEVNSEAEIADDHAFECMVRGGFGYERIRTVVVDDGTNEQEIKVCRIKNPFTVYFDPAAEEPDYSDAKFCFIITDMGREEYKAAYPKSKMMARLDDFESIGDSAPGWMDEKFIRVAEYFFVEKAGGRPTVGWAKINAIEALEQRIWAGRYIPVVPMIGDDLTINNERYIAGIVRNGKDAQKQYNFFQSAATERIALVPRAPYIATPQQIKGFEKMWNSANRENYSVLLHNPVIEGGNLLGPPQRAQVDAQVADLAYMVQQAESDLFATMGINEARVGEKSNEKSGKAILARQQQSQLATSNFADNAARALRYRTRLLIDLIPHIYDVTRIQRIINPDGSADAVVVYKGEQNKPAAQAMLNQAVQKVFDVSVGRYDVTVSIGPSFQTKRQESAAAMLDFMKVLPPQLAQSVADLLVREMDWPGADQIADRLKKLLPPELLDNSKQTPEVQLQQAQAKLAGLSKVYDLLLQEFNKLQDELNTKKAELASKEAIASMQENTKVVIELLKAQQAGAEMAVKRQMAENEMMHRAAHERAMQAEGAEQAAAQQREAAGQQMLMQSQNGGQP